MDISKISIEELQELQARIPDEINNRKALEKKSLLNEITELAAKHGYRLDELINLPHDELAAKKNGTRKPAKIKYRNPNNPDLTWTGRGKKPVWVATWLTQGKALEDLKVD